MKYLVDTDWIIHHLHNVQPVIQRLYELAPEGVGISIISVAELYQVVFYADNPRRSENDLLTILYGFDVLNLNDEICRIFARERGRLKAAGNIIGDFDILIGATAIHHDLTLLTNNRRHFERMQGLTIISV